MNTKEKLTPDLSRLLRPNSIAVVGGGAWCNSVVEQCLKMGFEGTIWPIHPKKETVGGLPTLPSLDDLPGAPDATFIGVNRHLTIEAVRHLQNINAGGAVCFASGFREAQAETGDGDNLQSELLEAAGDMPIIGPNCYGFINYLDGALLWPDQHGGTRVDNGVAILTQSSNMAINLTMQARGLPLAYVVTAGNQAQIGLAQIGRGLLADPRVTTLGMHIEGVGDLRAFEALAADARRLGKALVALKAGKSEQARAAAVSHTASLAGSDAGARALLARLGIAQVDSLTALLEALKLLHFSGPLPSSRIVSMSCSGGEASLMADAAMGREITFPALSKAQHDGLRAALGPMVALANPLDYHTFIWDDVEAMTATFTAALSGDIALGCLITDYPRPDRCDPAAWDCTIAAGARASKASGTPLAIVATLPEAMTEETALRIANAGLIPMHGLDDTLSAIEAAAFVGRKRAVRADILLPGDLSSVCLLMEAEAKAALAEHGLSVPRAVRVPTRDALSRATEGLNFPVVLKAEGLAHKTEAGGVVLGLQGIEELCAAAQKMETESFLVEEMITGGVAELLIGVVRDPAHGFVLTIAAGGTLTELMQDSTSRLLPVSEADVHEALDELRIAPVLNGYRGAHGADRQAIVTAILAVQAYVTRHADTIDEVEINPLICTPERAVAADALIRIGDKP